MGKLLPVIFIVFKELFWFIIVLNKYPDWVPKYNILLWSENFEYVNVEYGTFVFVWRFNVSSFGFVSIFLAENVGN